MDEWNRFLEANREQIRKYGSISPAILLLRENSQPTACILEGFDNGDKIVGAIMLLLEKVDPDSYIFSSLGWGTEFYEKVWSENPEYEQIVDMPLDDREEYYIQIEVIKPGYLSRSYMAAINRDSVDIFYNEDNIAESKFILHW